MLTVSVPDDLAIGGQLREEMAEVEARFAAEVLSDLSCVNDLLAHVERYRGKMLRPMLALASGMITSPRGTDLSESHRVVATVGEMVHMATLVHDDVLDEAEIRRGGVTLNHLRGNETAVMLGDYLISHAYHLCCSLDSPLASRLFSQATNTVCEGELLQLANRNNWHLDERTYFEMIRRKTASLCGVCCRLGAMLHDAPRPTIEALSEYGEQLGVAFQIVDDLLDLTGEEKTVGKSLGRDLAKGKLTLPLIHAVAGGSPEQRDELLGLLHRIGGADDVDEEAVGQVRRRVVELGSVEYGYGWAKRLVQLARRSIAPLPEAPARTLLMGMAEAVLTRKF